MYNKNVTVMKKILFLSALVVFALVLVSCGTKKVVKASYPEYTAQGNTGPRTVTKVEEKLDDCELESLNEPETEYRAYGTATDEDYDFARHQATLNAKAALADRLQSQVINVMKAYREKTKTKGKTLNEAQIKQDMGSMAEQTLEDCRVVCSKRYRMSDGTYQSSVCVAIPSKTAETMTGAAALSEDERVGVEFHAEQFRDSYKEELERFRKQMQKK